MSLYLPMTSRFLMTRFLAASFAMGRNTTQRERASQARGGALPADNFFRSGGP